MHYHGSNDEAKDNARKKRRLDTKAQIQDQLTDSAAQNAPRTIEFEGRSFKLDSIGNTGGWVLGPNIIYRCYLCSDCIQPSNTDQIKNCTCGALHCDESWGRITHRDGDSIMQKYVAEYPD